MGWIMVGMAAVGAASSIASGKEKNKAIESERKYNTQKYKMTKALGEFAQFNNSIRSTEIQNEIASEAAEAQRDITIQVDKQLGDETIRRGEGLTAGTSVVRSIDSIIQSGAKARAGVNSVEEDAQIEVRAQERSANTGELHKVQDALHSLIIGNAQLAASRISTSSMIIGAVGAGAQGAATGANLQGAFKSASIVQSPKGIR